MNDYWGELNYFLNIMKMMMNKRILYGVTISLLGSCVSAFEWLAGSYEPQSIVTSHAAIDLDQQTIDSLLRQAHEEHVKSAKEIYTKGGYSMIIAKLKVTSDPPGVSIPAGSIVEGESKDGYQVDATLIHDFSYDTKEVFVEYVPSSIQEKYMRCQVGGLVTIDEQNKDGCFLELGQMKVLDPTFEFNYTYNSNKDNYNGNTIRKFSNLANDWAMFQPFAKFVKYYGASDYGNKWVEAAFDEETTHFDNGNGDFEMLPLQARVVAIESGMKLMNIWMYVIRMMEDAIDRCEQPDSAIYSWDQAVAFYAGSLGSDGVLMYSFADEMCIAFHACGIDGSRKVGTSFTNNQVIDEFKAGQKSILQKECDLVRSSKERIVELMTIPLIQGSLYMAYLQDFHQDQDDIEVVTINRVRGASFAAAVLPIVHDCNESDATTIYNNIGLSEESRHVDFLAVKLAFENNYECLGITCQGVGGVWEAEIKGYANFASPCGMDDDVFKEGDKESSVAIYVLFSSLLLGAGIALTIMLNRSRQKKMDTKKQSTSKNILVDAFQDETDL